MKRYFIILTLGALLSCQKKNSKVNALEANDWFRDGVDRFYLAVAPRNLKQEGSVTGAKVGQNMIFGLGCYAEPKKPDTLVNVEPDDCNKGTTRMPLNERYQINHFNIAEDPLNPKKGECVVLLGDEQMLAHIQLFPKDYQSGPAADAWAQFISSAGFCAASLSLMHPQVRAFTASKVQGLANNITNTAGNVATNTQNFVSGIGTNLGYFSQGIFGRFFQKPAVPVPPSKVKFAQQWILNGHSQRVMQYNASIAAQVQQSTAAGVRQFFSGLGGNALSQLSSNTLAFLPCGGATYSLWELVLNGKNNKNRAAFFRGLLEAENLANKKLMTGSRAETYKKLVQEKRWTDAASIKAPLMAYTFNRHVTLNFEQGWQIFGNRPQNFFDTVKEIQGEIAEAAKKQQGSPINPDAE